MALVAAPTGFAPLDLLCGAILATPAGFVAGVLWQLASDRTLFREHRPLLLFMTALSVAMPVLGYFVLGDLLDALR